MEDRDCSSWFHQHNKTPRNNYVVLEEIHNALGFSDEETRFMYRLLRKTEVCTLHFQYGNVGIDFNQVRALKIFSVSLRYEKGTKRKTSDYEYSLATLDELAKTSDRQRQ